MNRRRPPWLLPVGLALTVVLALLLPAAFLTPQLYGAYTSALQALGIVLALVVAVATLRSDSRDRRLDRVLGFHRELTSGQVGEARSRLGELLKSNNANGAVLKPVQLVDLRKGGPVDHYADQQLPSTPQHDLNLLLRFFERVWIAHERGSLDDLMLVAMVGRHATWWDMALSRKERTGGPLALLADWSNEYALHHANEPSLAAWGQTRSRDFGAKNAVSDE